MTKVPLQGAGGRGYIIANVPMRPISLPSRRWGRAGREGSRTQFPPDRCQVWGAQSWRDPASAPPRAWIVSGATPAKLPTTSRPAVEGPGLSQVQGYPPTGHDRPGTWALAVGAGRCQQPVRAGGGAWRMAQWPPPFPSWPLSLVGSTRFSARRRGLLTVGVRGQVLSFRTPGGLRRIPASQPGGRAAALIMKKGACLLGCGLATPGRRSSPHLLLASSAPGSCGLLRAPAGPCGLLRAPAGSCGSLRAPADEGLLWPLEPQAQPGS